MTNNPTKTQDSEQKQLNITDHDKAVFEDMVKNCLNLHVVASKGFGKSRLLFSIADHCRNLENSRVLIFDGSDAWLYGFSQIATFNINEQDISASIQRNSLETEHYRFNNWQLVLNALNSHDDLLFRLKTKKPSKRGFAIRSIIDHLDNIQRQQAEANKELKQICYFIEEAQDCFNTRSTMRTDSETFLTVFNEARNFKQSFFTASQRLNDFSKTIRTKQNYCIGRINVEDVNPQIRRIEKLYNLNLTTLKHRTWLYEGSLFVSPDFKQNKKPFIINAEIRKEYNSQSQPIKYKFIPASDPKPKRSLLQRIFNIYPKPQKFFDQTEENIKENEKGDFLALDDEDLMFSESS